MLEKRLLGKTGIQIAPLVLGGNVFGWTADEPTSFKILDRFVELGGNMIDTADVYSGFAAGGKYGESERVIGKWMKSRGNRHQLVIATKVGYPMSPETSPEKVGLSKKYILQAVEDSLARLQIETIDLYQSHRDDLQTPIHESLEAYTSLIHSGKIRFIGASQCTPERLREWLSVSQETGLATYTTLQPHYNLVERAGFEEKFQAICLAHGLGVITFFGLARGFLTGKYRSLGDLEKSVRGEGVKPYMNEKGFRVLAALDQVSKSQNATPAQVALAWLMAKPAVTAPIASATRVEQLKEIWKSVELKLDLESLRILDQASQA
jgi:aryl-alcohol dehydrogenase-like predicted oxidoreductase